MDINLKIALATAFTALAGIITFATVAIVFS
ncbi:YnhF family membrane protein [Enterovibrio makurazakiensis]|uniref:YnhF family membrane protein n=1 Tax=Enterovibrio gelatinilyticus TaxID=2899819 RepID=A0ABT5QYH5_9GAMM|nr:YnhF family membrane protein [Enterovibrio sp. ZSDZ42]MDD1793072.1 YnhF family membrane protein [Enterovibrio sp. ZSDZ42]